MKKVVFVGITDKKGKLPFASSTKSGMILDSIIKQLDCLCEKINYVSFAPINEEGKLRYPSTNELQEAYPIFQKTIQQLKPNLLVVCGNMIFHELQKHSFQECEMIKIYHPSYVWVYRRTYLEEYTTSVVQQIKRIIS